MAVLREHSAPALERGLAILELLPKSRAGLTLSQLARQMHLPKSSLYCLLRALQQAGYVYRDSQTAKFRVSLRVCALAQAAVTALGLREQARPFLRRLAESVSMTVHLAVMERASCILIDKVSPPNVFRVATWVGKHLGIHCTAVGKALVAYLPDNQIDSLVHEHGLIRHNDNTIFTLPTLKRELATVRARGYACDDEEEEIGIRCIGAPIFADGPTPVAAISIVGTSGDVHDDNWERLAQQVIAIAAEISDHLKGNISESLWQTAQQSAAFGTFLPPAPLSLHSSADFQS